jgi:hypothetical protein
MRQLILFLGTILSAICSAQSTDQIAQNGGFENGIGYPTDQNQLDGMCNHWIGGAVTPDWYTTQNLPGALRGACNFEHGDNATVMNATPKLATHDGSLFYGGFGSTEHMRNELSRRTYTNSLVKVSFWFSPRGVSWNTRIGIMLIDSDDNTNNIVLDYFDVDVTSTDPPFTTCQWYYYESDWLPTGSNTFDQVQIGGMSPPNPAGAFNEVAYIYVDDANVYNGINCCPDEMHFEDNGNLANETHVRNYIVAGYDAGIPNISGDVVVHNGQNVTFQAGNSIDLRDGFYVEGGADFSAYIRDCNPFTQQQGSNIVVETLPNVFTPNNDNVNDELCFNVSGAQYYTIQVFSRWGTNNQTLEYVYSSSFISNIVCTWDGGNNEEGTYYYIVTFSNCETSSTFASYFTLLRNNQRSANPADSALQEMRDNIISVFPNPTSDGSIIIDFGAQSSREFTLYNSIGELISVQTGETELKTAIRLEGIHAGIYFLRILHDNGKYESKPIVVL